MSATALIVAAGKGERLGGGIPKQFRPIGGKPVLRWAVEALASHPMIDEVWVVVGDGQQELAAKTLAGMKIAGFVSGGDQRADSVRAGLAASNAEVILVHDAARPFCPPGVVDRLLAALRTHSGAAPVLPVGDTLARAGSLLDQPIDRSGVVRVQTPQAFRLRALREAYARWTGPSPTDETTVARAAGIEVATVEGDPMLDKLTTPSDWQRAEALLAGRLLSRTGMGFDVHAFAGDGPIMLGGVAIPFPRGLAGHSDADVILHAITDALLGAAGLGDIGEHFPPSDARWKDASSDRFLSHAVDLIRAQGGIIDNVDCTLICEAPKLSPYRSQMRSRIAEVLGVAEAKVSIKATTTERLGFTGRGEGIAAQAVATVRMES